MKQMVPVALLLTACSALAMAQRESRALPQVRRVWSIAFVRDGSILACNGDGSGQKLLIENGYSPAWSPDRSQIAFARDGDIWVAAADGTGQRPITTLWAGRTPTDDVASEVSISWHPSGGSLTFSHREAFKAERAHGTAGMVPTRKVVGGSIVGCSIFDVRVAGWQPGHVTARYDLLDNGTSFSFGDHAHPAWSPSGRQLAFTRNGDIWIAAAKGGVGGEPPSDWEAKRVAAVAEFDEPERRVSRDNRGATRLSWHPDGRRLVYGYDRLQGSGFNELHLLDTVSGKDSLVIRDGLEPCVSPDGSFVLYRSYGDACGADRSCICAVTLDGKNRVKLLARGAQPVW
jgi:Tol biopolymer transport system component